MPWRIVNPHDFGITLNKDEKLVLATAIKFPLVGIKEITDIITQDNTTREPLIKNGEPNPNTITFKLYIIKEPIIENLTNPVKEISIEWKDIPEKYKEDILDLLKEENSYLDELIKLGD